MPPAPPKPELRGRRARRRSSAGPNRSVPSRFLSRLEIGEPPADLLGGPKKVRLDRPGVQARDVGDLGNRHFLEVLHHEDRALPRRQRLDSGAEPLTDLASGGAALRRRLGSRRDVLRTFGRVVLTGGALVEIEDEAAALQAILAPVDADPRQPRLEGRALTERVETLIRPQEAFLRRAVRFPGVAQEPVGDACDPLLILPHEILEQLGP